MEVAEGKQITNVTYLEVKTQGKYDHDEFSLSLLMAHDVHVMCLWNLRIFGHIY